MPSISRSAFLALLLLAACSGEAGERTADEASVSVDTPSASTETAPSTPSPSSDAEPLRNAADVTGHVWRELERNPESGEWFVPAPGLAIAFPADEPSGGAAADDPDHPTRTFEIHPNRRISPDGDALTESSVLSIADVRIEGGAAVLLLRESYRLSAEPDDRLGTRDVRVRISPMAGEDGVYRWEFSYASPDPCAGRDPCGLRRPLWVGSLGTRWLERADPAEGHPLDQTETGDESGAG